MKGKNTMIDLTTDQKSFVNDIHSFYKKDKLTRGEINSFWQKKGYKNPSWLKSNTYKIGRGLYTLPVDGNGDQMYVNNVAFA